MMITTIKKTMKTIKKKMIKKATIQIAQEWFRMIPKNPRTIQKTLYRAKQDVLREFHVQLNDLNQA